MQSFVETVDKMRMAPSESQTFVTWFPYQPCSRQEPVLLPAQVAGSNSYITPYSCSDRISISKRERGLVPKWLRVSTFTPKDLGFDSWSSSHSGHVQEATNFSLSLSIYIPPSLSPFLPRSLLPFPLKKKKENQRKKNVLWWGLTKNKKNMLLSCTISIPLEGTISLHFFAP